MHRDGRWLLGVRAPDLAFLPGLLGLLGGHLEPGDTDLEATARRELQEETGVDLSGVALSYLESALLPGSDRAQLTVTFVAEAPPAADPRVHDTAELTEVGWWTVAQAAADPRCPIWLPALLHRAAHHHPETVDR